MKIIILQYIFLSDGSTNALLKLLNSLSGGKYEFLVIYSRKTPNINILKNIGVKCVRIPYLMSSDRGYKGMMRCLYLLPLMIINTIALLCMVVVALFFKPNIIHTNVSPIHLGCYLAKILNIPHIWHLREFRRKEAKTQPFFNHSYFIKLLNSSRTIATTKSIKEYYELNDNCRVIYDGVINSNTSRQLMPLKNRLNSFLFVGRVEQSKGIEILIDGFARFSKYNDDWQLDIIGGYSEAYYNQLIRKIRDLKIENRVCFLGVCNDVQEKMSERKVVVISSLSEGFGYVTVEAMHNKCFVIANDNTGTKEQLDNAKEFVGHDVAFRFTNSDELFEQMRRLVAEDIEHHQALVNEAYMVVNKLYGVDRYTSDVARYYQECYDNKLGI